MIEAVSAWIKQIILLVLFASFLELLLPSSGMQRFIRVIVGLLITLAILNPVLDVVQNNWSAQQVPALSTNSTSSQSVISQANKIAGEREQLAVETYKKELGRQIKATVSALGGVADVQVAVSLADRKNSKFDGRIDRVTLYIKPGVSGETSRIEPVTAGPADSGKSGELSEQLKTKISKTVGELYQVSPQQLEIKHLH
ncbi:stage III sporulation protein AF|uniref:Stage III sporulation protein AF n=1 Tax=Dendrosporobacter quercicolus TaxID=146817 RepID=A0A1G9KWV2_9FIRM|nr:stage III sporulation protein AF [Dendrosporobacter quercicolus]NSL46523.1 stage III sporulation protein AF [Dendrosporobacter quercicolus DSM 1736]SDL54182.1 stage III sporulation protein AF [Dendrosporobacter quercicolus]